MRDIKFIVRSHTIKLKLFKGTEDEGFFEVKSLKRGKPYALAYGVKHYLTDDEAKIAKQWAKI